MIYHAEIYQKLLQTETGLYAQSPSYIYELLEEERKAKKATASCILKYMACIFCYMPYAFFALRKRPFSRPLFLTKNMTAKNKNQKKALNL